MQPTARSLILDLLSTLRRGTMPVRALVEAGGLLAIAENNIRVSLARLYASGRVERDERGRYRLGSAVAAIRDQLHAWRKLDERTRPWDGSWIAVQQPRLGRGPARRQRERALGLLGLRELEPGFSLRPDNLDGGIDDLRSRLADLARSNDGREPGLGRVFLLRELDPASELEARGLWNAHALAKQARTSLALLKESQDRLYRLSQDEAMIETFRLGGRVLRQLVQHPLLPPEILDPAPLDALLVEMKRYDEIGRGHWAPFLARHAVPHRALPLDSRFETPPTAAFVPYPSDSTPATTESPPLASSIH